MEAKNERGRNATGGLKNRLGQTFRESKTLKSSHMFGEIKDKSRIGQDACQEETLSYHPQAGSKDEKMPWLLKVFLSTVPAAKTGRGRCFSK